MAEEDGGVTHGLSDYSAPMASGPSSQAPRRAFTFPVLLSGRPLPLVNGPMPGSKRRVFRSLLFERGHSRLQFGDGLVLALRLIRQFPEELQNLTDEVLRPSAGVQWLVSGAGCHE